MSVRPANWQELHARRHDNPINRHPPGRFPYIEEIMRVPAIMGALDQAWHDTNADHIPNTAASEQGGWIYMNLLTGVLTVIRKDNPLGAGPPRREGGNVRGYSDISLDPCPTLPGSILVAYFHTHPSYPFSGASDPDRQLGDQHGVPGIVVGRDHQYAFTGPERKAGRFSEARHYPGFPP